MLLDLRIDQLPKMRLEAFVSPFLVHPHQARIARHIGSKDRGKTAGRGHGSGSPPLIRVIVKRIIIISDNPRAAYSSERLKLR
jgi:hypothetical protein